MITQIVQCQIDFIIFVLMSIFAYFGDFCHRFFLTHAHVLRSKHIQFLFLVYRYYIQHRTLTSMNFDNPVYRKTTEDQFSLEKNLPARVYPSSIDEEVCMTAILHKISVKPDVFWLIRAIFASLLSQFRAL